jgi:ATP-dependent protease HslVU (ClpYQ) peptidase subunit
VTTIVAIQTDDGVDLAADAQVTNGNGRIFSHPTQLKITERGKYLLAGAGDSAPCDYFQHTFKPPTPRGVEWDDLYHFMIAKFVPALKKCLKENDWKADANDSESGFSFLVVVGGEVFSLDDDFSIALTSSGIYGIGSGSTYAVGALLNGATLESAMQIACANDAYSSGPIQYISQASHRG